MSSTDVSYTVQVGALISEDLLRLLAASYDHKFPIDTKLSERDLWTKNGEARFLQFLRESRLEFLDHARVNRRHF
jgi:hypothetical protein